MTLCKYILSSLSTSNLYPQQERRTEKKANKLAFKQEKAMQEKQMVGLRANVQGLKLS